MSTSREARNTIETVLINIIFNDCCLIALSFLLKMNTDFMSKENDSKESLKMT